MEILVSKRKKMKRLIKIWRLETMVRRRKMMMDLDLMKRRMLKRIRPYQRVLKDFKRLDKLQKRKNTLKKQNPPQTGKNRHEILNQQHPEEENKQKTPYNSTKEKPKKKRNS
jgi:hypothetical protein